MLMRHLKHYEILPVLAITGVGVAFSFFYLGRLALKNPDCSWDKKNNPHPWLKIRHDENVKFLTFQPKANFKDERPKF
ncbi:cytochrome c oxidase subunit NDUFA4-like [Corticium candelabrum]|uniref:cytochrome c oxidase subunit NDUFA4-like n=1 Tax=Corticium candelabrum TaxID=121492 RepID=UPI002E269864|nr:cytochrome c oxidase subunit NDUFA4-like [Corticium candelabrum]